MLYLERAFKSCINRGVWQKQITTQSSQTFDVSEIIIKDQFHF